MSDYTLCSLFPPQLKQMSELYKVMCGCECCIYAKIIHSSLLSWRDRYLKKSKIKAKMLKTEGLAKNKIAYMNHMKYSHATWTAYLCQIIGYGKGYNVCISSV